MQRLLFSLLVAALTAFGLSACATSGQPVSEPVNKMPSAQGLNVTKSPYDTAETAQRFENVARNNGLHIFDIIDHAQGAAEAGLDLAPTQVVIFGNPKAGTPLMQCSRTIAIDLPSKALIWTDDDGQTWLAVNDTNYLAARHRVGTCPDVIRVNDMLRKLVRQTVAPMPN